MNDTIKAVLAAVVLLGVFGLCGVGVYKDEMSVTAAMATALSALSSAGVLAKLFGKDEEDEG